MKELELRALIEKAEKDFIDPLASVFRKSLLEAYQKGVLDGIKAAEQVYESDLVKKLGEEAEAMQEKYDEPIVKLKPNAILKRRIHYEDFRKNGVRIMNGLRASDIETLGDLMKYSEKDIMRMRNMGTNCVNELRWFVEQFGLKLRVE